MSTPSHDYSLEPLTKQIIGACFQVYSELGYGFLESVYEAAVEQVLLDEQVGVRRQVPLTISFRGRAIGSFRADLIIADSVILELKAGKGLDSSHEAQLLNILRATTIEIGLLFNFGPRPQLKRLAFSNSRKNSCVRLRSSAAPTSTLEEGRR